MQVRYICQTIQFTNRSSQQMAPDHQIQGGPFLDAVACEGLTVLELPASEDIALLPCYDSLHVLNLLFHVFNCCVRQLNL